MNPMHEKIDGDLLALIEGKLSAEESERIRAWLAADPHLSEQVAGMILDREVLRVCPKRPLRPASPMAYWRGWSAARC